MSTHAFAQTNLLTCVNTENGFTTTFLVDNRERSITHLSSYAPDTKQRFSINEKMNLLEFNASRAIALGYSNDGKIINLRVFNFDNNTFTNSGHYLTEKRKPFPQLSECVGNR